MKVMTRSQEETLLAESKELHRTKLRWKKAKRNNLKI